MVIAAGFPPIIVAASRGIIKQNRNFMPNWFNKLKPRPPLAPLRRRFCESGRIRLVNQLCRVQTCNLYSRSTCMHLRRDGRRATNVFQSARYDIGSMGGGVPRKEKKEIGKRGANKEDKFFWEPYPWTKQLPAHAHTRNWQFSLEKPGVPLKFFHWHYELVILPFVAPLVKSTEIGK